MGEVGKDHVTKNQKGKHTVRAGAQQSLRPAHVHEWEPRCGLGEKCPGNKMVDEMPKDLTSNTFLRSKKIRERRK